MARLAEAFIGLHADGDPFEREVGPAVKKGAELAEDDLDVAGKKWGEVLADSTSDELEKSGPKFAKGIEDALQGQKVKVKGIKFEVDKQGNIGRRWVSLVTDEIQDAFKDEVVAKGFFSKIQMAVADAIGAGFNISGRSPLVAILVPLIGAIVALVLGAIQAINGLAALLVTIPGLVVAAGIQIGVLMLAFEGLGTAIQGAFAAENAQQLNEALKNLTPSAKEFVRSLLPLEDFFKTLQRSVQEGFFSGLGDLFGKPIGGGRGGNAPLQGLLEVMKGLDQVANSLGKAFREIAIALGGPEFTKFIELMLPSISKFLSGFGPALGQFFTGLGKFAGSPAVMDFIDWFGEKFNGFLSKFGAFLYDLAGDQGFAQWLEDMKSTLSAVGDFLAAVGATLVIILDQVNKAGGEEFLRQITEAIITLNTFLASDTGKKGIEGLLNLSLFLLQVTVGLIAVFLTILALGEKIGEIVNLVAGIVKEGLIGIWNDFLDFLRGIVKGIFDLFTGIPGDMFMIGRNMILALGRGMFSMLSWLRSTVMSLLTFGIFNLLPHSPAKEGPLAGHGDPMLSGRTVMDRLAMGMTSGLPQVRNATTNAATVINFGSGAISVGFDGVVPTPAQARTTGSAVGQGILGLLNRDAALGVRALAPMGG